LAPTPDEKPISNQVLLRLLMRQKNKPFTPALGEEADAAAALGPNALSVFLEKLGVKLVPKLGSLTAFRDRNAELNDWRDDRLEIEDCAVLGLFPQSTSDLLQDYDDLLTQIQAGVPPAALLGCAVDVLPADLKSGIGSDAPVAAGADYDSSIPVLYADPIQRQVLKLSKSTTTLVVDGPPGTGKSQVIVNLVADALSRGEKVAVVCEKRAALDVVVNRMESIGFRHLLALVHDVQDDRRALYKQLAARIEDPGQRPRPSRTASSLNHELAGLTAKLTSLSSLLTARRSGISLYGESRRARRRNAGPRAFRRPLAA
jgi:hypothetical protein